MSAILAPTKRVTALLVASALSWSALAPVAYADEKPKDKKETIKPPRMMSSVGGVRLGKPGTQVDLGAGAPVLPKGLTGRSWIVADAESGAVLAAHNAHWRLPPASTLKMLFADTVLPKFPKTQNHKVAPSDLAGLGAGSSLVGIKEEQTYSVHDLWLGVFLRSGNDAVRVLSAMNGGIPQTVADMQKHAEELQALDTKVVSPDGYDEAEQVSSAYDLTLIARSGLQKKDFREYSATLRAQFPAEAKKGKKRPSFEIQNTNRLLSGSYGLSPYKGIAGVKNGNTTNAGATFTGVAERGGRVLLVTVMNPSGKERDAVYKETARLLDWGFQSAGKVTPVGELVPPKSADTGGGESEGSGSRAQAGGAADTSGKDSTTTKASSQESSGGMGIALGVMGGALIVLAAGVFVINRRWPSQARRP
ncbi:D-alanyl-D-alanine carboxypeptidase (penicillin-binding protein 5/6) [Streptomyces sp. AmelKG-E11A]|uniref:D-alanyl-D-alanine carboxypeptidase family protein n=1 Tax=Streptomyces sp. SID4919 TaxID=2690270 RepID=UPI000823DD0A|nr:D-alanyl-D-alanine carboxypeptidase (penicillin-binding protein 5/6) [Streptomyces sp. AmelKG-E11A]